MAGVSLSFSDGLYVMALANVAAMIPAAPGYIGTYDAAILLAVRLVGAGGATVALPYVVLVRFVLFVPIAVVGLVLLVCALRRLAGRCGRRERPRSRERSSDGAVVGPARRQLDRQLADEAGAGRRLVEQQRAALALGELAADREAEAEAALAAGAVPRWKRSKISSRSVARDAGAAVGDRDVRPVAAVAGRDAHRLAAGREAQRVVEQDPQDPRRPRPGRRAPSTGPSAG